MTPTAQARPAIANPGAVARRSTVWGGPVRIAEAANDRRAEFAKSRHHDPLVDLVAATAEAARMGLLSF